MSTPITDFTTIVGRLIAAFRVQLGLTQAELGEPLGYDRSLVARLEIGRNMVNVDNLHQIEHIFISYGLQERHGDLILLANRVVGELNRRGVRIVTGRTADVGGASVLDLPTLDRVLAGVVDAYLGMDARTRAPHPMPDPYWRGR